MAFLNAGSCRELSLALKSTSVTEGRPSPSLQQLLKGSKLEFPAKHKKSAEEKAAYEAKRELLKLRGHERSYQRMVGDIVCEERKAAMGPGSSPLPPSLPPPSIQYVVGGSIASIAPFIENTFVCAPLRISVDLRTSLQQGSIGLNMILAAFTAFVLGFYAGGAVFQKMEYRLTCGFVGMIALLLVEMVLYIIKSDRIVEKQKIKITKKEKLISKVIKGPGSGGAVQGENKRKTVKV
jgi:hypothetical protein